MSESRARRKERTNNDEASGKRFCPAVCGACAHPILLIRPEFRHPKCGQHCSSACWRNRETGRESTTHHKRDRKLESEQKNAERSDDWTFALRRRSDKIRSQTSTKGIKSHKWLPPLDLYEFSPPLEWTFSCSDRLASCVHLLFLSLPLVASPVLSVVSFYFSPC